MCVVHSNLKKIKADRVFSLKGEGIDWVSGCFSPIPHLDNGILNAFDFHHICRKTHIIKICELRVFVKNVSL